LDMSTDFEMNGNMYRIGRLNAFQQFHLSRRIAPLIPPLVPIFMRLSKEGLSGDLTTLPELLQPFADGLAVMKDEDAEICINTCMSVVKRQVGDKWASVWTGKMAQYDELNDIASLMPIVLRVIQSALGPFLRGLLTGQQTVQTPAA
jgi:hypothetical protein